MRIHMLLLVAALTAASVLAEDKRPPMPDLSKAKVTVTTVTANVHMLEGAGGNIALCTGSDGAFLVDDQFAPMTERVLAAVSTVTSSPVKFVINTHFHFDHTGGNENLARAGAVVVAHDNVRKRLSTEQVNRFFKRTMPPSPPAALPIVTFSDSATLHLNGQTVLIQHIPPAHTDGDSFIHFREADVIHSGDVFSSGGYPFIDIDSGGSIDGILAALQKLLGMAGPRTRVIPGHGKLSDREGIVEFQSMMQSARDRIAKLISEGKTEDQIAAANPLADLDARWGKAFLKTEQFTRLVYASLEK